MNKDFEDIVKRIVTGEGIEILDDKRRCKSFLLDYTKGNYKKETNLFLNAIEAGCHTKIAQAAHPEYIKTHLIQELQDDYAIILEAAREVIVFLEVLIGLPPPLSAKEYIKLGEEHFKNGDYDKAIAAFTKAIRIDTQVATAYYNRGRTYHDKKDYDQAIANYIEAIRLNPFYADAYYNRGEAYYNKKEHDRAKADYTEAVRLNPNYAAKAYHDKDYDPPKTISAEKNKKGHITAEMKQQSYIYAKLVYKGNLSKAQAAKKLHDDYGMNSGSAKMYITNFKCFIEGKGYNRDMKQEDVEYFLEHICQDYGNDGLKKALNALKFRIKYLESEANHKPDDEKRKKLFQGQAAAVRRIYNKWTTR